MNKYWVWFSRIYKIGTINQKKLLEKYNKPENIWNLTKKELQKNKFLTANQIDIVLDKAYRENLEKYIEYMEKNSINLITIYDEEYPENLKNIYDPPVLIYIKGNKQILNQNAIAIIGSRSSSNYGKITANKFAYELAKNNIIIVSGLARGIDAEAHVGTLSIKNSTIAVIRFWLRYSVPSRK